MLPLFRKITDNAQYLKVTRAEVAVLGRVERVCPPNTIEVTILTAYEVVATARVDITKKLRVRHEYAVNSAFFRKTVKRYNVANDWYIRRVGMRK